MIEVRDRIDEGMNRARMELELRRSARPMVTVVICVALGLVLAGYIAIHINRTALTSTYQARFAVADVTGVVPGVNEVRYRGVPAGKITAVDIKGAQPVLTVKIQDKYKRLYRDVRAQLRPSTALQDMFLDIVDRGTPSRGVMPEDVPVPAGQTSIPVNISDVLNVFGPNQRVRLRSLLADLGGGMEDRGEALRTIFVEAVPFIQAAGRISRQLQARAPMLRHLVRTTRVLTRELGAREGDLRTLVGEGSATLSTLQDGSRDLDATLRALPPTLQRVGTSFAAVRGVLGDVDAAVKSLYPVADRLPSSLSAVRRLADEATPAVRALQRPVDRLVPFARVLQPLAADLNGALGRLLPQIDTVDKVTKGVAGCKSGIQGFFQWNASISKFGDQHGPIPRGNVVMGAQSSGVLNDPQEFAPQACTPGRVIGGRVPTAKDMR